MACVARDMTDLYGIDPFADDPIDVSAPVDAQPMSLSSPINVLTDITNTVTATPVVQPSVSHRPLHMSNAFTAMMNKQTATAHKLNLKRAANTPSSHSLHKRPKSGRSPKPVKSEQLYLDAGQTSIGSTQCAVCGLRYYAGEANDEATHKRVHRKYVDGITYTGYKSERLVHHFDNGDRCVVLSHISDNAALNDKLSDVLEMMNHELGGSHDSHTLIRGQSVLLLIRNRKVAGACIVQRLHCAQRMTITVDDKQVVHASVSDVDEPAVLGVDKIWVHQQYRQQNIASKLVDSAREVIEYGCTVAMHDVAFSQPTNAGKLFASKYVHSNTFLIYS